MSIYVEHVGNTEYTSDLYGFTVWDPQLEAHQHAMEKQIGISMALYENEKLLYLQEIVLRKM